MVKTGVAVIDVSITRLPDGHLVGDVEFAGVRRKVSYIAPVTGGLGMTVTMLFVNTIASAQRAAANLVPAQTAVSPG